MKKWIKIQKKQGETLVFRTFLVRTKIHFGPFVLSRHCDIIFFLFCFLLFQYQENALCYAMVPNNCTLGVSIFKPLGW